MRTLWHWPCTNSSGSRTPPAARAPTRDSTSATDTADPGRGALLQQTEERATEIETRLLFFELEWAALDDEHAERLLSSPELDFCRHFLRSLRRYRPHLLSEPEEKIMAEKSISSQSAWGRLFGELTAALRVELDGAEVPLEVALSRLQSPDREVRRTAAEAVSATLEPGLRTRAFIYNTLVFDKSVEDRLRSYPHWLASRNLENEASDESVSALIDAVRRRYDIPQRWYRLKAKLLGVDRWRTTTAWHPWAARTRRSPSPRRAIWCSTRTSLSRRKRAASPNAFSTRSGSTHPCDRINGAERFAHTRCRASTPTCC